jgi:hypothetical protein
MQNAIEFTEAYPPGTAMILTDEAGNAHNVKILSRAGVLDENAAVSAGGPTCSGVFLIERFKPITNG